MKETVFLIAIVIFLVWYYCWLNDIQIIAPVRTEKIVETEALHQVQIWEGDRMVGFENTYNKGYEPIRKFTVTVGKGNIINGVGGNCSGNGGRMFINDPEGYAKYEEEEKAERLKRGNVVITSPQQFSDYLINNN